MARWHGRFGRVYMEVLSGSNATPVAFLNSWEINANTDKSDVTAFTDPNKIYVVGLPDASGSFAGFYDDATTQTYTAASDGLQRKFYLYPTSADTQYWYGAIFPDFKASGKVDGPVEISADWNAAGPINKRQV
jgi:hypothetical protein